ncbi:zinc finger protein squeeze [Galendromus occidentalis]|uniref:Zinc finger protein squeeze n=1 Tax=Galendromus occidentalis TaxID=34638 RepID=A0AAJ6VWI3_9ACAR|nr:zinc finger protein squeeze [Galendromus occidentalis]
MVSIGIPEPLAETFKYSNLGWTWEGQKKESIIIENDDYVRFRLSLQPPVCFDCRILMDSHIALYQHCRTHHPKSLVIAQCCEAEFYTLLAFAAHCESAHTGQHICIRCHKFFESRAALDNHVFEHRSDAGSYAIFCIVCGMFETSEAGIESHLRREHDIDEGKESHYICRVPRLALEMTKILSENKNQEGALQKAPCSFTPTLKDCMTYTLQGALSMA